MMRFVCLFFSCSLHAALLLAGLHTPMGTSLSLHVSKPVYRVDLVQLPKPAVKPRRAVRPASVSSQTPAKPQPKSSTKPRVQRKPKSLPAKKISPRKSPALSKRVAKKQAPPKKKAPPRKVPPAKKAKMSSQEVLAQALKGVQREVHKKTRHARQDLAKELAGLRKTLDEAKGTPGQDEAVSESGLMQVYGQIAETAIKEHWRFPRMGGTNLVAHIEVRIDHVGNVLGTKVLMASGREDFDGSALRAIHEAEPLPKPPSKDIKRLIIHFNQSELQD